MAGGRPTKYKPEYCEDIVYYFKNHSGFPTFEHFAVWECDCTLETLHEWRRVHPEFSEAYKKAKQLQAHRIIEDCASGEYKNGTFAIFMMKNCHNWKDKQETEVTGLESININIKKRGDK